MTALSQTDRFLFRHLGPRPDDIAAMLQVLGYDSLDSLADAAVPEAIRFRGTLHLPPARTEGQALHDIEQYASMNQVFRSLIGMGFHDTVTPAVLLRNLIENPGWYTQYTPYQPEISQGRLECLLNFQTMIKDLTGLDIANSSLLDEATACAEAMTLSWGQQRANPKRQAFLVDVGVHPQNLAVVQTRAKIVGIEVVQADAFGHDFAAQPVFGVLLQYPNTYGQLQDPKALIERAHQGGALVTMACDLLALALVAPPGELGADIAVGNTQRFGVPLGFGGPHAAFFATKDAYKRAMPGRLVGVSVDAKGNRALRLALQTREQHIRRDKASSNICTAQVLLAILASLYGCWHGPDGLRDIAARVHRLARLLAEGLRRRGFSVQPGLFFDTLRVDTGTGAPRILEMARTERINLRDYADGTVGIALDEITDHAELAKVLSAFSGHPVPIDEIDALSVEVAADHFAELTRRSDFMEHPVFRAHHSETEMMRYLHRMQARDLSLTTSMIPLGSCTMKLNAAAEMLPITMPGFAKLHPFAPPEQARGYHKLFGDLQAWLAEITGFVGCSLQPNAGSQGEYTGLQVIRAYLDASGGADRNICLIPQSAHGTNPATAVMAGMQVVVVGCDSHGNIDVADLKAKALQHQDKLAALMVTYPSTHGVFEEAIKEVCTVIHAAGGQVYMDGANLNAQVGLCRPGDIGADVCHINLHKTFSIPHGGGGPGMGPICVAKHLAPYLPGHPLVSTGGSHAIGAVSSSPWGSASILPISWMYIAMLGPDGVKMATQVAILNANYIAKLLHGSYPVLYRGDNGLVAHECILDTRTCKPHVEVDDIAKRLMDFGFHAPTMSFPVPGTLMVEPTESESKAELDRFILAMTTIKTEIDAIASGASDAKDNPLKNAPHTLDAVTAEQWAHPYSRQQAAFPVPWLRELKFWPLVARIDNAYGDRNLVCDCPPIDSYH